jgi:hypothetical protein
VTPAGNAAAAGLTWKNRVISRLPSKQQAINVGGIIASAINPMWIFNALAASTASRSQEAMEKTIQTYEQTINQATIKLQYYLDWAMFIAFLAVISHFIPRIAMNLRRTVHVFTHGNAEQVVMLTGSVTARAIQGGGRSRSRSRSRVRALPAPRSASVGRARTEGLMLDARTVAALRRMSVR